MTPEDKQLGIGGLIMIISLQAVGRFFIEDSESPRWLRWNYDHSRINQLFFMKTFSRGSAS
jgi:hypothetical protein